ncbi:MAG: hypothetical protein ACRELT_06415 [Longimicrobiales bacterium]
MNKARRLVILLAWATALAACADRPMDPLQDEAPAADWVRVDAQSAVQAEHPAQEYIHRVNERLAAEGKGLAIARAEWLLAPGSRARMSTVFAADRQLRLDTRWVPGDPRRDAAGNNLTHATFLPLALANGVTHATAAIRSSFETWEALPCFQLDLIERQLAPNIFPSAVLAIAGFSNDPFAADISTVGFLPPFIFDAVLGPGASEFVLGVTFTFVFIAGPGGPASDIDGDGRDDTALKEIWYNDGFSWTTTGGSGIDIETVALHENGHALELGHFGRIAVNRANMLTVSPRAVMNAIILGTQRSLLGTDEASLCGEFGNWP